MALNKKPQKSVASSNGIQDRVITDDWYRALFEHTGTAVVVLDGDMSIFSANGEFNRLAGVGGSKIGPLGSFFEFVVPEDQQRIRRYHAQRRMEGGKAPSEYEFQLISRSGEKRLISLTVDMIPGTDKSVLSLIDITVKKRTELALRESERRMTTLLNNFPGIVYRCKHSDDWQIEYVSPGCRELTGHDAGSFMGSLDRYFSQLIHPDDRKSVWNEIQRALQQKKSYGITYRIRTLSGQERWVWEQGVGHYSDQGEVVAFEGFITDITERKRMEIELIKENEKLKTSFADRYRLGSIIGRSPAMKSVYELILRAAATNACVVIIGKSGTGKELVARAIHDMSDRKNKAFVPVNCGAIPENLLESEFFGYKKGSFTGANTDTRGYLEVADGGSLFLDELEELSPSMQVKLLRVIDGYGFTPVGGSETKTSDVRIIAATNVELQEHVQRGLMREDFYFRINVFPIRVPTLKERPEDIPLLLDHFLEKYSHEEEPLVIPPTVREALKKYDWPGNVRELQNTIQRYAATGSFSFFTSSIPISEESTGFPEGLSRNSEESLQEAVETFEKQVILRTLERNYWRRGASAAMLKIDRKTLLRKMKRHGIQ